MKSRNKVRKSMLSAAVVISAIIALVAPGPVLATPYTGTTTIVFSANPATLSGDSTTDVTITTTTTAPGASAALISAGRVMIELASDGTLLDADLNPIGGNPVPSAGAVYWMALNGPGVNPDGSGVTTLDVDLDALGFVCGTVGGFRAHYVTGGGKDKVDTHFSAAVDLTAVCPCVWIGETAWADGVPYGGGQWATYTPYVAGSTVTLYAGQTMEAGTVHFSAPVDGTVTITLTLNDDWRFEDVDENVKIQDYDVTPPAENPNPGGFAHKGYASGSPFEIDVPENNYYGVHVDVEWESCE